MAGKAIDIRMPGVDTARVRATAMHVQYGGVGYYAGSDFVHVDTGQVRAWPRMSKEQLIALFPDGKTLHLPASGSPLPGYEQARVEVRTRLAALADTPAPPMRGVTRTAAAMSGRDGPLKSGLAGPVQVASAAASIGVTGSVTARVRDERTFLSALFVSPTEPVTSLSTPLMHMAAFDQPRPLAGAITGAPTVVVRFNSGARTGLDPNRFRGPAVQPLPTSLAAR